MTERMSKSARTRERILAAANTVLLDKGYAATRLEDIAEVAGTKAGAMYYYFASKDALIEALLERNATRSWASVERKVAALPPGASYRDKLIAVARAALGNMQDQDLIVYMRIINEVPGDIRKRLMAHARISRHFVKELIREGQGCGEFRADVNPTIVALMLLSNLIWCYDWFHPAAHRIDRMARDMCNVLLKGLEQPQGEDSRASSGARRPGLRATSGSPRRSRRHVAARSRNL